MQKQANEYNAIAIPLEKTHPKFKTIMTEEELKKMYKDWEIIYSKIKTRKTINTNVDTKVLYFLAKKKETK